MLALDKVFKTYVKRPVSISVSQWNIVITLEAVSLSVTQQFISQASVARVETVQVRADRLFMV